MKPKKNYPKRHLVVFLFLLLLAGCTASKVVEDGVIAIEEAIEIQDPPESPVAPPPPPMPAAVAQMPPPPPSPPPQAQGGRKDKRNFFRIRISQAANACFYEIEDYDDQEVFRITPHGVVQFRSENTAALVSVFKQTGTEIAGTDGPNALTLEAGNPRTVTARGPRGSKEITEHRVRISCCNDDSCSSTTDAEPITTGFLYPYDGSKQRHGGMIETDGPRKKKKDTGPVMKVEDD